MKSQIPNPKSEVHTVRVTAPSRLHFGLLSFGNTDTAADTNPLRQFGGVGAMIEKPGLRLNITRHSEFTTAGPLADRAGEFVRRWIEFHNLPDPLKCRITIEAAPPEHMGLGVGTQLGLAVSCGLNAFHQLPTQSPIELAQSVGRGLRSAVGTYGFTSGGLIVERGKLPGEPIAPLDCRLPIPEQWRFVLIRPHAECGLSGENERSAFATLPSVPVETTAKLTEELRERMLPAVAEANFAAFSDSIYRFGHMAGTCFAPLQGGPYNGPQLTRLVETIRSLGILGVGQSSWGPTLFSVLASETEANDFVLRLRRQMPEEEFEVQITRADNRGVRVEIEGSHTHSSTI